MEKFKNIISPLFTLFMLLSVVGYTTSCTESDVDEYSCIEMSKEFATLSFSGQDEGQEIVIITTTESWSLTTPDSWIHTTLDGGSAGKSSFYVTVDANDGDAARYGTIELSSGHSRYTIVVDQDFYQYLDVDVDTYYIDGEGSSFTVIATTNQAAKNIEVYMSSADKEWIDYSLTEQSTDNGVLQLMYAFTVKDIVEANEEELDSRSASVVISYSKEGVGDTFYISQSTYPVLEVVADEIVIATQEAQKFETIQYEYFETATTISVASNVEITVGIDEADSWVTLDEAYEDDGSTRTYTFTLEENGLTTEDRSCDVKIMYCAYDYSDPTEVKNTEIEELTNVVTIKQSGKDVEISIPEKEDYEQKQPYIINRDFKVVVYSNVVPEINIADAQGNAVSWLSVTEEYEVVDADETEGNGDDAIYTFSLQITQNDEADSEDRAAVVTLSNSVDDTVADFTLTQSKEEIYINVDNDTLKSIPYTANESFEIVVGSNGEAMETPILTFTDNSYTDWFKLESSEVVGVATEITGVYNYTYKFNVEQNFAMSAVARDVTIKFATKDEDEILIYDEVTITQEPRVPVVVVSDKEAVEATIYNYNVGGITLAITSDIPLSLSIDNSGNEKDWSISQSELSNGDLTESLYSLEVTIPENDYSIESVSATISLVNSDYGCDETITITQEAMPTTFTAEAFISGTLSTLIEGDSNVMGYDMISISGEGLNEDDFTALKLFTGVKYLDISGSATTAIPELQFAGIELKEVSLPTTLESIGASAFSEMVSLTQITGLDGVTSIGDSAFYGTTSLTQVSFPKLESIGALAFSASGLTSVTIPSTLTTVGDSAFASSASLASVDLTGVTAIGYRMFYATPLKEVTIPSTVKTWDNTTTGYNDAFYSCTSLTKLTLEDGLTSMGVRSFAYAEVLESVSIPGSITDWTGGGTVTPTLNQVFNYCYAMSYVEIGEGLAQMPSSMFANAVNLKIAETPFVLVSYCETPPEIIWPTGTDPNYTYYVFSNGNLVMSTPIIYVPEGCVNTYTLANGWSNQANIYEIQSVE